MTLYMIGIGLWDEKDISVKGLEAVKRSKHVFLENYTSKLSVDKTTLEKFYGRKIVLADREMVEKDADSMLADAKLSDVSFLVVGDVFGATTHTDLFLRAKEKNISVVVINNASILNAIGVVGLELYKFGKTTSIPFHNKDVETPYNVIKENKTAGMHTLALLDIDAKNEKYMSANEAIKYLLSVEEKRKEGFFTKETKIIALARIGSSEPGIVYAKAGELIKMDFGKPLHSLIIPGTLHFMEEEALVHWKSI